MLAATDLTEPQLAGAATSDAQPWDVDVESVVARADLVFLLERYCAARTRQVGDGSGALYLTPIEARLARALDRLELPFRPQVQIPPFTVDFLVGERVVIECDGAGYHDYRRDRARDVELEKLGFHVLRVSGGEIYRAADACAAAAADLLRNHSSQSTPFHGIDLSNSQGPAAVHGEGPAWVAAPAGSGKTRVVQARISHLLATGVNPVRICAVSFTNRAVDEMRNRLPAADAAGVRFTTLDALAKEISELPPHGSRRTLIEGVKTPRGKTRWQLLSRILEADEYKFQRAGDLWKDAVQRYRTAYEVPDFADFPEECRPTPERFLEIHDEYESLLCSERLTDFAGRILDAVRALTCDAEFRSLIGGRYDYWIVDEFQDLPPGKVALLRLLSSPARNLFVVGDDDQVIYGFAGASPSAFPAFDDAFPDRVAHVLAENYRSPPELVRRSMSLIERNVDRIKKDVASRKPPGPLDLVTVLSADDYAHHGVAFVTQQLDAGFAPHEIALLFRLRDMAVPVERALVAERIPHIRCSRQSFFDRKIVQYIRAWLRVSAGSTEPVDYSAALAWPTRYLRTEVLERITSSTEFRTALLHDHEDGLRWLETSGSQLLNETNAHAVADFVALIRKAKERRLPAQILEVLELRRAAESETAPASEAPPAIIVDVVHRLAAQFPTVRELESWIATRGQDKDYVIGGDEDGRSVRARKGCVTLATIHQVKGQEFRAVGVLGPLEGMPDKRARLAAELEEERRIAYVAITRAQQRLLFCASAQYAEELVASRPRSQ